MERESYDQHDEINLIRLVRRLEKSTENPDAWKPTNGLLPEEIWLKTQKTLQKVKFARRLLKNVEVNDVEPTATRIKQFNAIKIKLDRLETFLKDVEASSKPKSSLPEPILPTLPVPRPPLTAVAPLLQEALDSESRDDPPAYDEKSHLPTPSGMNTNNLTIVPPDPDDISPSLISTALPSLLPTSYPLESVATSSFSRNFGTIPSNRKAGASTLAHGSTALHEELSSQLELMAQQLKRNAIHFSSSLETDKAVVGDAQVKLESNFDMMQKERVRLRDHRSQSRSTTCMVVGIVLLVVLVFMLMVSVIRFS